MGSLRREVKQLDTFQLTACVHSAVATCRCTRSHLAGSGINRTMSESSLTASKPMTVSQRWAKRAVKDELYKPACRGGMSIPASMPYSNHVCLHEIKLDMENSCLLLMREMALLS